MSRRPRRRRPWRIVAGIVATLVVAAGAIAAVPPWHDAALTSVLLFTGDIAAPSELKSVALCASLPNGPSARTGRHLVVPRGRVVTGTIVGRARPGARRPYFVYLPPGYNLRALRGRRYPTVYLLHGAPGQAHDWYWAGKINIVADRLISSCRMVPMILVMPDGNGGLMHDTQYVNRWDGRENVETYIVRDVVGFVDRHFRTLRDARFRAVMGLSAGGYGAVNLTVRNPSVFGAAVALAGYFRADPHEVEFGDNPFDHSARTLRANSPILRIRTLPPAVRHRLHILLYDGANDDEYAPKARAFARELARDGVPHYWDSRVTGPLGLSYHTWIYWRDSARDALARLSALFVAAQRPPA